jgi:hypothetical protein
MKVDIAGLATTLLVSGGLGLAGLGLGAGAAHADDRYGPHTVVPRAIDGMADRALEPS